MFSAPVPSVHNFFDLKLYSPFQSHCSFVSSSAQTHTGKGFPLLDSGHHNETYTSQNKLVKVKQ